MNKHEKKDKFKKYGTRKSLIIKIIYIIGLLFWLFLIIFLNLNCLPLLGIIFLLIPIIMFLLGFINSSSLTIEMEEELFKANFLTIGLIIALPLLIHISKEYCGDKCQFITVVFLSLVFSLLSLLDFWTRRKWLTVSKHIKSTFQTIAITLFIIALYLYYLSACRNYSSFKLLG